VILLRFIKKELILHKIFKIMSENCNVQQRPQSIKAALKSWWFWKPALGVLLGALAGFLYYWFVGCSSGSCAITSNPYMSILWGAAMGFLLTSGSCRTCR
jgi:hypothetical protein